MLEVPLVQHLASHIGQTDAPEKLLKQDLKAKLFPHGICYYWEYSALGGSILKSGTEEELKKSPAG